MKKILPLAILASIATSCSTINHSVTTTDSLINPYNLNYDENESKADKLLAQMTLEEKIGQLNLPDAGQSNYRSWQKGRYL